MIPNELLAYQQWVLWRWEERGGKRTKIPYATSGREASSTDAATWSSFTAVMLALAKGGYSGIGFVLSPDDPFTVIDLDHAIEGSTTQGWAAEIVEKLDTYAEISPSRTGLHLWLRGKLPEWSRNRKDAIEVYERARYITVTGDRYEGKDHAIAGRQEALDQLCRQHLGKRPDPAPPIPVYPIAASASDYEVLDRALKAANGAELQRLVDGDTTAYSSSSEADLAFCSKLSFYTSDPHQVDRLLRASALYRKKWDRIDYREKTLAMAFSNGSAAEFSTGERGSKNGVPPLSREPDDQVQSFLVPVPTNTSHGNHGTETPDLADLGWVLTKASDLLVEKDTDPPDLVEGGLFPAGGLSIIGAKPKAGKSTLVRQLAVCIAKGKPFLGRAVRQGKVLYLALEEKRKEVREHFRKLGVTADDELFVHIGPSPKDALEKLKALIAEVKPILVIIDTLFRFVRVKDTNAYAEITEALSPILGMARSTGTHVNLVHHNTKVDKDGADSVLGSIGIVGSVDTTIVLRRRVDGVRYAYSEQRYGVDLPATVLTLTEDSHVVAAASLEAYAIDKAKDAIEAFLLTLKGKKPVPELEILERVEMRKATFVKAIRALFEEGRISRWGTGRRNDPYTYGIPWGEGGPRPRTGNDGNEGNDGN